MVACSLEIQAGATSCTNHRDRSNSSDDNHEIGWVPDGDDAADGVVGGYVLQWWVGGWSIVADSWDVAEPVAVAEDPHAAVDGDDDEGVVDDGHLEAAIEQVAVAGEAVGQKSLYFQGAD